MTILIHDETGAIVPHGPYLIFTGDRYYARGGANDLYGVAEYLADAEEMIEKMTSDPNFDSGFMWWHVYDLAAREVVLKSNIHAWF